MTITTPHTNDPLPAGARPIDDWLDPGTTTRPDGHQDIEVYSAGVQHTDNSVTREIMVRLYQPITVDEGRRRAYLNR